MTRMRQWGTTKNTKETKGGGGGGWGREAEGSWIEWSVIIGVSRSDRAVFAGSWRERKVRLRVKRWADYSIGVGQHRAETEQLIH